MGAVASTNIVTDGLIACFDPANRKSYPGAGTTCTSPVNNVVSTLENTPVFNPFKGGYFEFDGTNDYLQVTTTSTGYDTINLTGTIVSLFVWVSRYNDTGYNPLICKRSTGCPQYEFNWYHSSGYNTGGTAKLVFEAGGCGTVYSDTLSSVDQWHYVGATYDGTTVRFYVDGEAWGTASMSNTMTSTTDPLRIANNAHVDATCDIGIAQMYNRVLTAAEVLQNYEATKPRFKPRITKSGLVGNWDAGDPASYSGGLTCKDTASGTEATLEGGLTFNSANGGYWEFDGTDDYIQCSDDSVLQPQSFSVEAWVYDHQPATDVVDHNLPIVAWRDSTDPGVWTSYHSSNKKPYIYMGSSGTDGRYFDATAASVVGWHHVVFTYTYDDITTGAFYVDGVSQSVSTTYDDDKDPTDRCRIGRAGLRYYQGSMGLVRIYDTPLSAAEILDNYNKTKARFGH